MISWRACRVWPCDDTTPDALILMLLYPAMSRLVIHVQHLQDFAEKPKGDALEKMKVDTTVLGKAHLLI